MLKATLIICLLVHLAFSPVKGQAAANNAKLVASSSNHIMFAGYEWEVKQGHYYPGKNDWLADNAWVDHNGFLHLKISQADNRWYCAEITSVKNFGYGSYQFQVIGPVDNLDPNIVLGLFVYPGPENPGKDNEIDIEFTKWGDPQALAGNYTVTPSAATHHFPFTLEGEYTTHQFTWINSRILFQSFYGHTPDDMTEFCRWLYNANEYRGKTAVPPVRVHINLWLFSGKPPLNGREQEIIIRDFTYKQI